MHHNPAGTDGFDFLEFSTPHPDKLIQQFETLGFSLVGTHKTNAIQIYQQNDIRFIINVDEQSHAYHFSKQHGPSVTAMGFRLINANEAYERAVRLGGRPYLPIQSANNYDIPAIYGVGDSLIYFVDYHSDVANYTNKFDMVTQIHSPNYLTRLSYLDHVTHNLFRGNMQKWADFYTQIFNFHEVRHFDIEGKLTGLVSKAMASPCGKIRIPLNESSDDYSQIEEFLKEFNGEGIQHIALGSENIYASVEALRKNKIQFLDTPDTYYELIEKRLPKHGENTEALKQLKILIDGSTDKQTRLLLQIFTKNMLGPVFFEIIERKGDEGFGEGNFKALFESIELDQIKRGVLTTETSHETSNT